MKPWPILLVACLAWVGPAAAHDIYQRGDLRECCHDHDCRAAAPGEIVEQDDGTFLVTPTGEVFSRHRVKASPDGRYHRCLYDPSNPVSRTFCVLVPAAS